MVYSLINSINMQFKDFIPLLGTIVTAVTGYYLISAQISKNRRAKWIDDFREHLANLNAATTIYFSLSKSEDQLYVIYKSVGMLKLYIDLVDPFHKIFFDLLKEFEQGLKSENENDIKTSLNSLGNVAYAIIDTEQKAIFRTRVAIKGKEYFYESNSSDNKTTSI